MNTMLKNVIEGFTELTQQQIFDMAAKHIGSTGKQSTNFSGSCVYGGSGCNAAPLLTATGKEVGDMGFSDWLKLADHGDVPNHEAEFIAALQEAHDNCYKPDGWAFKWDYDSNMRVLAHEFKLNTAELDKLGWKKD